MIEVVVYGTPAAQGSKGFKGFTKTGRAILAESSKKVKPWRQDVKDAAIKALETGCRIPGPVRITIVFTMKKPAGAPKRRVTYPDKSPDLDKLLRSTFDALVQSGIIDDDARVVEVAAVKAFPGEYPGSLPSLGARIKISSIHAKPPR